MSAPNSLLLRACNNLPVDRTPVWLMRQAGRYMTEYRAVRKNNSLIEICKKPSLAAEVTITAAEALNVDAAIIFADLLLPLEVMGLPFRFSAGEGPVIEKPLRSGEDVARLRTDSAADLGYVAEAVRLVADHFGARLPVIGFCGAPFTLASYMIEGGGSRHYIHTKKMMYGEPEVFDQLLGKIVAVTAEYATEQDYRKYVLPRTRELIQQLKHAGAPVIYFGTDTATLLPAMRETGADVIGLDWRIPLDQGRVELGDSIAVQGNLDPVVLLSDWKQVGASARDVLDRAAGKPGHIFNLGHGILPETPVENVKALVALVQEYSAKAAAAQRV
jgi:uroporphyrinogen decarboxylase